MEKGGASTRLAWWLSPAFPVGAYAYSHGLEWAAEAGDLSDEAACASWIGDVVCHGAGRNDAILLRHACGAMRSTTPSFPAGGGKAAGGDVYAGITRTEAFAESPSRPSDAGDDGWSLSDLNDLALALTPSGELRLETAQQGRSFLDALNAAWPEPRLLRLAGELDDIAYPVAVGVSAAVHRITAEATVPLYLSAFAHNLVSAAMRLAPIGQNAGLRILASLEGRLAVTATDVMRATLDDIGGATFRADLGSFRHETQYTRLFRS